MISLVLFTQFLAMVTSFKTSVQTKILVNITTSILWYWYWHNPQIVLRYFLRITYTFVCVWIYLCLCHFTMHMFMRNFHNQDKTSSRESFIFSICTFPHISSLHLTRFWFRTTTTLCFISKMLHKLDHIVCIFWISILFTHDNFLESHSNCCIYQ